eukprot:2512231-Pyramimonas_sp.AAC.1
MPSEGDAPLALLRRAGQEQPGAGEILISMVAVRSQLSLRGARPNFHRCELVSSPLFAQTNHLSRDL